MILGRTGATPKLTCAELADLWLDTKKATQSERTWYMRRWTLQSWCDHAGKIRASEIKPYHVTGWLDAHPGWGANMRSTSARVLKTAMNWAVGEGYLEVSPLAKLRCANISRSPGVAEADLVRWLAEIRDPALRDWVDVALDTGCRPGEQLGIRASDVRGKVVTVRGKSGTRPAYLTDRSAAILARLAESRPHGPILRTPSKHRPWTAWTLGQWFEGVSERSGVKVVPKSLRKVFATRSLRVNGEVITARLLGHKGLGMLAAHYASPEESDLISAVSRVAGGG